MHRTITRERTGVAFNGDLRRLLDKGVIQEVRVGKTDPTRHYVPVSEFHA